MRKYIAKAVVWILILVVCIPMTETYQANTEEWRQKPQIEKVRMGIFEMDGFHYHDENGELTGYCIDYLKVLARLGGWEYEFVEVNDFMDACKKLEAGEIDLVAPAVVTDARRERFAYTEQSIGTEYTVLLTGSDRTDLYFEDFSNYNGMKVAVLKDYPLTDYFISYMNMQGFQAELIYFDTSEESYTAMKNGQVDAMIDSIMNIRDEQKLLARFTPQPVYFLMNKEDFVLQREINMAMETLQSTYPTLQEELLKIYFPLYNFQFYTRDEIDYIEKNKVFRVAYVSDRKPLSFTNEEGQLDGISREIFDRISALSGLRFEYVELPEGNITYDYLLDQEIDLITGVEYNSANMNSKGIFLSRPYISARKVMVSNKDFIYHTDGVYKIAVASGSQTIHQVLLDAYPNLEIIDCDTNQDCFTALYNGEVDMLLQNQYVVEAVLSKPIYSNFVIVPMEGLNDELCFSTIVGMNGREGMCDAESELLISILNKAISRISDTEMTNLIVKETLENQYELELADFLFSYRYTIVTLIFAFLVGTVLLYVLLKERIKRKRIEQDENKRNALQQKRYETILECSDDLIYEISLAGESCLGSEKIKEKFGWEIPKEVEDLDFAKAIKILHIHPEDEAVFRKTMMSKGVGKFDEQILRIGKADGTYLWCKISRTVLMDDKGNVVSILGKIADVDEEIKEKQHLELRSRTDPLTGLLNKMSFEKDVRHYIERQSTDSSCFVFLDMDHFKDINDIFGHNVGDQVIKETAKKVQLLFANFDLVSRFGGDEFCVFVKEIPRETLIDRLRFAIKKMEQEYPYEGGSVKLSASIGAAYCKREHATYKELLEIADEALYQAKDNGRNCYIIKDIE